MNQDIRKRWVDALRSGKYKQTTQRLRTDKGFCCLGVLCDVVKDDIGLEWVAPDVFPFEYVFAGGRAMLPQVVIDFCEFTPQELLGGGPSICAIPLIRMNDNDKKSFNDIANAIEVGL